MIQDLRVAAVGDQSRLHRSQPVVRAAATTSTGRTICTSISIRCRAPTFERVRETALVVRDALDALKMPSLREDHRLEGHPRLRADRARPDAEGSLDVRQGAGPGAGATPPGADHRRIPHRQTPARAACWSTTTRTPGAARWRRSIRCGRRPSRASTPVTWDEVERGIRIEDFRIDNVPARSPGSAICGSRCWPPRKI